MAYVMQGGSYGTNAVNARTGQTLSTRGKVNDKTYSLYLNGLDRDIQIDDAINTIISRFKWEGTDIDIFPEAYIERLLYKYGFAIAYISKEKGFTILGATVNGLNYFYEPSGFTAIANGFSEYVAAEDCVMIRENPCAFPLEFMVERQSEVIADTGRAIQNYIQGMKFLNILITDPQGGITAETVAQASMTNEPYIVLKAKTIDNPLDKRSPVEMLNNGHTGQDLQNLIMAKATLFNECLAKRGINSNMMIKETYRSESEQEGDSSHIQLILRQANECRQKAVNEMREKFGVDINCLNVFDEIKKENQAQMQAMMDKQEDGAQDNAIKDE